MSGREVVGPEELSFEEGAYLVRVARKSVEHYLKEGSLMPTPGGVSSNLRKLGAAFVTIESFHGYDRRELRGCIGYVEPVKPLVETVIEVAVEAAFNDPRFPPLSKDELSRVTFEVSVLSGKEPLPRDPKGRLRAVVVGKHGLVVEKGPFKGLLLPQVPVEYGWDVETFLGEACVKAGLLMDCWVDPSTAIYKYEARVFREVRPGGDVEERDLVEELKRHRQVGESGL